MIRRGLISSPRFQREENGLDRRSSWLELFYDLIFVVAVSQVADTLNRQFDFAGLARFSLLFLPVWWAWVGHTFYLTRFDSDDLIHRIFTAVKMFAVAVMAIGVPHALDSSSRTFIFGYCSVRTLLVLEYFRVGWSLPETRPLTWNYALGFFLSVCVWIASSFLPLHVRPVLWVIAIGIDFATPLTTGKYNIIFPPNTSHIPERFGAFTIIVLGEAVLNIVVGLNQTLSGPDHLLPGFFAWILAFTLWWGYFDGVKGASQRPVGSWKESNIFRLWMYAHLPLTMSIAIIAVAAKHQITRHVWSAMPGGQAWILTIGLVAANVCLNIIFLTANRSGSSDAVRKYLRPHWILAGANALIGILAVSLSGTALLAIAAAIGILLVAFSLRVEPS